MITSHESVGNGLCAVPLVPSDTLRNATEGIPYGEFVGLVYDHVAWVLITVFAQTIGFMITSQEDVGNGLRAVPLVPRDTLRNATEGIPYVAFVGLVYEHVAWVACETTAQRELRPPYFGETFILDVSGNLFPIPATNANKQRKGIQE